MKILIVSAYFYPDIEPRSFRTIGLVEELLKRDHNITLYIPYRDFDYTLYTEKNKIKIKYLTKKKLFPNLPDGNSFVNKVIGVLFSKLIIYTQYPFIRLFFCIPLKLYKLSNYDLMISIAAPHSVHWGCAKAVSINKKLCKKWIADCGDPFMGDQTTKRPFYFKYFENYFCKKADYITIPIANAITSYYPEYRSKIKIIPQGFDFSDASKYVKLRKNICPTFAYAGAFYAKYRDPTNFLDYLTTLNLNFKFVMYTGNSKLLDKYANILGDKLEVHDYIPRDELLQELSQMDFLINIENKGLAQSPSKLIDYALVHRPIFPVSMDNSININLFVEFLNGDYQNGYNIGDIDQYNIHNVVDRFLEL
jgi:hypothetical protein